MRAIAAAAWALSVRVRLPPAAQVVAVAAAAVAAVPVHHYWSQKHLIFARALRFRCSRIGAFKNFVDMPPCLRRRYRLVVSLLDCFTVNLFATLFRAVTVPLSSESRVFVSKFSWPFHFCLFQTFSLSSSSASFRTAKRTLFSHSSSKFCSSPRSSSKSFTILSLSLVRIAKRAPIATRRPSGSCSPSWRPTIPAAAAAAARRTV